MERRACNCVSTAREFASDPTKAVEVGGKQSKRKTKPRLQHRLEASRAPVPCAAALLQLRNGRGCGKWHPLSSFSSTERSAEKGWVGWDCLVLRTCSVPGCRRTCRRWKGALREKVEVSHQNHTYSNQFFRRHIHSFPIFFFWLFIFLIVSARDRVLDWASAKQVWQTGRWILQKITFGRFLPERQHNILHHVQKNTSGKVKLLQLTSSVWAPW